MLCFVGLSPNKIRTVRFSILSDAPSGPPLTQTGTSLLNKFVAFSTNDVFHDEGSPSMTWEDVGWCVIAPHDNAWADRRTRTKENVEFEFSLHSARVGGLTQEN